MLFPQNIGSYFSIDETAFSNVNLYTNVTSKNTKGKKSDLIAIIKDTKEEDFIRPLSKIALKKRKKVIEITLDIARNNGSRIIVGENLIFEKKVIRF